MAAQAAQEQFVDHEQFGRLQHSAALAQGAERDDAALGQARVVAPVELLQRLAFGQPGQRVATLLQPTVAAIEFVLHESRERLDEVHLATGHLECTRLQGVRHAR